MPAAINASFRLSLFAVVAVFSGTCSPAARASEIYWLESPEKAAHMARQLGLPVVMFITSDSCTYCRKMEQESWANHDIQEMVDNRFVPLKLHATRHNDLVTALGVRAFPTTILFSAEAKPLGGAAGYLNPPRLAALLRKAGQQQPAQGTEPAVTSQTSAAVQPIAWHHSARTAFQTSEQIQRPLIVYVSSEQCGYCRKMEREVWATPEISALVQADYVPLALKAERDAELVAALNVNAYPTTIVISPERKVIGALAGYVSVAGVTELLHKRHSAGSPPTHLPMPVASR